MSNESPARILYDENGNRVGVAANPIQVTGFTGPNSVGITGPVRVDVVGITGPVGVTFPQPVAVDLVDHVVGITGPVRVDRVGITGPVGLTGPVRVDSVGITGPVGLTGSVRVDSVGITGPVRVDRVGITGPMFVAGFGGAGTPTAGLLTVQGVSGAFPQPVVGAAPNGLAVGGNPVLAAGRDVTSVRTLELRNSQPTGTEYGLITRELETTCATFYAVFDRITLSANKYLATLFNTSSTRKVVVQRIWVYQWQFSTVAGGGGDAELVRITARTAGTSVTIRTEDTNDSLSAGISADTNSSAVTEDHLIMRVIHSGDDTNLAASDWLNAPIFSKNALRYERKAGQRGITLRQNQGISLQWISGDADGTWSVVYEFTDEVA